MPFSTITATLDHTLRCTFTELCSQPSANLTQDASISFTTLLTAGSTLLATVYAAASSSLTLSSIKLYSFYSKQCLLEGHQFIEPSGLNATLDSGLFEGLADNRTAANTSPTQSEIVSITGALIVFTVLLATVLLTHLFDTIDNFTRKCCRIKLSSLLQVGLSKGVRHLANATNQLLLDLVITIVLKSTLLTSLFVDEKSLKLNKKLSDYDGDRSHDEGDESRQFVDELIDSLDEDRQLLSRQRKWSTWFAGQLRKRLVH